MNYGELLAKRKSNKTNTNIGASRGHPFLRTEVLLIWSFLSVNLSNNEVVHKVKETRVPPLVRESTGQTYVCRHCTACWQKRGEGKYNAGQFPSQDHGSY